ncbi:ATP-binding protein [Pseudomonas putida]
MRPRWLDCSGNQSVLQECEALLKDSTEVSEPQGRLIFVMGAPRAGASALAHRLHHYAKRQGIRCLALPGTPWGSNSNLRNHFLQTLEVPLVTDEFWSNELASRPYDAVVALRGYQAVFVDDGHDYFTCAKTVKKRNFERLFQLTEFPNKRHVFVFGIANTLESVAQMAEKTGVTAIRHHLKPMPNDDHYHAFVGGLIAHYRRGQGMTDPMVDITAIHRFSKGSIGVTADVVRDLCAGLQLL